MNPKVDVFGSCISFNILNKKNEYGPQWHIDGLDHNIFINHVSMFGATSKPINIDPDDYYINTTEHWKRVISEDFNKTAIGKIEKSDSEWLIIDLYTMARIHEAYEGGCRAHVQDLSVLAPEYWQKIKDQIGFFFLSGIPFYIVLEKLDNFLDIMINKYGSEHIILNRFRYSKYVIDKNSHICDLETIGQRSAYGDSSANDYIHKLEEHIISKYGFKYIDVAKYYIADWYTDHDEVMVHFERDFFRLAGKILKSYILGTDEGIACDKLDIAGLRYKLMRSREVISDSVQYLNCAVNPFTLCAPLDRLIISSLNMDDIRNNAEIIADVYQKVCDNSYYTDSNISEEDRYNSIIELFESANKE